MDEGDFEILETGLGASLQDQGRVGWRRFGVPPSGAMDDHAMVWANQLLDNSPQATVLELLLQGARIRVLRTLWIAVTGADAQANIPTWRTARVTKNDLVEFLHNRSGVWIYLAVEGGFDGQRILGSSSAYPRGGLVGPITRGQQLHRLSGSDLQLPQRIAGRFVDGQERRHYDQPAPFRVWCGPQWSLFNETVRDQFLAQEWTVSSQSDRVGYRLQGETLRTPAGQIVSEPVLVGSVQIPPNGQPIVTMRDGPTVGGYPKIAVLDPADVSRLAQCRPGTKIRFTRAGQT